MRREFHQPVILTLEEVERLIDTATEPRNKALIALIYSSGLRLHDFHLQSLLYVFASYIPNRVIALVVYKYGLGVCVRCQYEKLKLEDSGIVKKGKKIYNICSKNFKYGFTTVSKIEDTQKVSGYITKYITKELITKTKGKHRYLCSRNLDTAEVENVMFEDKELFLKSVESNPKVCHRKTYTSEATGQKIEYIKVKK